MTDRTFLFAVLAVSVAAPAFGQLRVTEVMYDPASDEGRWEWIEVHNPGVAAVDLDGWFVDRIGDSALADDAAPQIRAAVDVGGVTRINPTTIPAGGVAVLYDGAGLGYDAARFRSAWPQTPSAAVLIGVDGWSQNVLNNSPTASVYAPNLPGRTVAFWSSESAYRLDTADTADAGVRVVGAQRAALRFSYDDADDWPRSNGAASIYYTSGSPVVGASWARSEAGVAGAYLSTATSLSGEAINGADFGSPGIAPPGAAGGLVISEIMYDPASTTGSTEWEWIELVNGGPAIDFAATPYYLDDDDGSPLDGPNVAAGVLPTGGVAVLYNAAVASPTQFGAAWPGLTNNALLLPIDDWPALANSGDLIGLWDDARVYESAIAADSLAGAVAGVVYDDTGDWPSNNGADSISLATLSADPSAPTNWRRASDDPAAREATTVFASAVDNSGADVGSPGLVEGVTLDPVVGDYNADGLVNAADYTVWRDGGPLANETASLGAVDAADYEAWASAYGAPGPPRTVPEPLSAGMLAVCAVLAVSRAGRGRLLGREFVAADLAVER